MTEAAAPVSSSMVRRAYQRQLLIGALALGMMVLVTLVLLIELRLNDTVEARYQQALAIAQRALDAHRLASQFARRQSQFSAGLTVAPGRPDPERMQRELRQMSLEIDGIRNMPLTAEERGQFRHIESSLAGIAAYWMQPGQHPGLADSSRTRMQFEAISASLDALSAAVSARALQAAEHSQFLGRIARYTLALAMLLAVSFGSVFGVLMWRSQKASRDVMSGLDRMAREDGLTGITNRRGLDEGLAIELARARRTATELTVVMLDLDYFKRYNDRRGHGAGDQLLRSAAQAWRRQLRPTDLLARYGGEEFTLVLPSCDADAACQLIDRLRPLVPERQTFSAGVATWEQHESPEQLLARADRALLVAKKEGRNKTIVSGREPQMNLPLLTT
jgi:diguanylate cyclase (GGDEF)-like protein